MKRFFRFTLLLSIATWLAGCAEEPLHEEFPIVFSMDGGLDVALTKSVISNANLGSGNTVKVYADKGGVPHPNFNPALVSKNASYWSPSPKVLWEYNQNYAFRGYAYSNSGVTGVSNNGYSFTVIQPTSYSSVNMVDYVFSNVAEVTTIKGSSYPDHVSLTFDHVLPAIEVYVTCAEGMRDVTVTELTLSGLYYSAEMQYSEKESTWLYTNKLTPDASYSVENLSVGNDGASTQARINLISVPQILSDDARLVVSYRVNESMDSTPVYRDLTQTFMLKNYLDRIVSGHRTIIHMDIDTGIHLRATIAPWTRVDYIEGIVLPPLD